MTHREQHRAHTTVEMECGTAPRTFVRPGKNAWGIVRFMHIDLYNSVSSID